MEGEKCTCDKTEPSQESDSSSSESPTSKEKKSKSLSLTSLGLTLRRGRSLHFKTKRSKKSNGNPGTSAQTNQNNIIKSPKWGLKFNCAKKDTKNSVVDSEVQACCKCTCYRKTDEQNLSAGVVLEQPQEKTGGEANVEKEGSDWGEGDGAVAVTGNAGLDGGRGIYNVGAAVVVSTPFDLPSWMSIIHVDSDEAARRQRLREIEQGVDPPANFRAARRVQLLWSNSESESGNALRHFQLVCPSDLPMDSLRALFQNHVTVRSCPIDVILGCHTQVDFIHCLVPDLLDITNCSFYWGIMDRYEAERLLDGKPEGTFLLRDSAQEEFLFSVSFRKYEKTLHARIEQWNHKFSFDSHDPGVYTSDTVCGLIEHYKDPSSCMFFEPTLTWPLHRNFTFSLQHLCRATITSRLTYDNVNQLQLPKSLKRYLKEYHYSQKVRVERFDDEVVEWLDIGKVPP